MNAVGRTAASDAWAELAHALPRPRAVLVAWDTLTVPTYRHEALASYQSGRVFDDDLLEQLDLAPELVEAMGFVAAKADGYEADDFLAAGVAYEEAKGGNALVASGDSSGVGGHERLF